MAQVSLIDTAAQLGRISGQVPLSKLRTDGYSRTFAGTGYRKVNHFEVHAGRAQDPDEAGSEHRLGDWLNYDQDRVPGGSQLAHTLIPGGVALTWTRPPGYTRAPENSNQRLYAKDTGETEPNEPAAATNPYASPHTSPLVGDGTSFELDTLASLAGQMVAIGLKAEFSDSVDVHTSADGLSYVGASGETLLTGAGTGILVGPIPGSEPTIDRIEQDPEDPGTCVAGSDITIEIFLRDSFGEVFLSEKVDGGSFGADFSVGVVNGSAQVDLTRQANHTYEYRPRYAGGAYGASKSHFLNCTLT